MFVCFSNRWLLQHKYNTHQQDDIWQLHLISYYKKKILIYYSFDKMNKICNIRDLSYNIIWIYVSFYENEATQQIYALGSNPRLPPPSHSRWFDGYKSVEEPGSRE